METGTNSTLQYNRTTTELFLFMLLRYVRQTQLLKKVKSTFPMLVGIKKLIFFHDKNISVNIIE